jgi:hypothetical protein|tara:strand:- start:1196 stop:1444 length:249 start_codon:yes stop_codon:yes gene_type:complete
MSHHSERASRETAAVLLDAIEFARTSEMEELKEKYTELIESTGTLEMATLEPGAENFMMLCGRMFLLGYRQSMLDSKLESIK